MLQPDVRDVGEITHTSSLYRFWDVGLPELWDYESVLHHCTERFLSYLIGIHLCGTGLLFAVSDSDA